MRQHSRYQRQSGDTFSDDVDFLETRDWAFSKLRFFKYRINGPSQNYALSNTEPIFAKILNILFKKCHQSRDCLG